MAFKRPITNGVKLAFAPAVAIRLCAVGCSHGVGLAGYPFNAGQLEYNCGHNKKPEMPILSGCGLRSLKPLCYKLSRLTWMPVLRNIWAWLHAEVMVQPRRGTLHLRPALLCLDRQLMWLMLEVAKHYRLWRHMPTYRDLYFQCPMPRWRAAADDLGRLVKPPAPEGDITVRHMLLPGLLLIAVSALVWSPMQAPTGAMVSDQRLLRGPYLQSGTPHSIVIRWRTQRPTASIIRYGPSAAQLTQVAHRDPLVVEHEVELLGLEPATRYYYSIGSHAQVLAGSDSQTFFETAPLAGESVPVRIWAIGDSGTADDDAASVYHAYRAFTTGTYTNLLLMLGDNAYSDGTDDEYQRAVFDMYPDLLAQSVVWPTLGNHDAHTADSATQSGPYYDIFTLPTEGEAGGVASGTEAYYAYDYANIHFIVLDSADSPRHRWSEMMQWLEADLQATTAYWIIAYWHHPPYSKGSHDSDFELELIQMRFNAVQMLERYGADLVLSGHSHNYERSKLINGHYSFSFLYDDDRHAVDAGSGRDDETGAYRKPGPGVEHAGTVYVVAGSSGKTGGGPLNHPAMYISLDQLGSLVIDIEALTLNAKFLDASGAVRDSFTIQKDLGF